MRVYLDDERETPSGWHRCFWPEEVILLLSEEKISHLSLDHDLGDLDDLRTGYHVLLWLEEKVFLEGLAAPRHMQVHSDNSSAREKMLRAITSINKRAKKFVEEEEDE